MAGLRLSRRHRTALVGGYAAAAVSLTALLFVLDARLSERTGLRREVYANAGFDGAPLVDDVSPDVSLSFLTHDPEIPHRFFSARWRGFWYVPESGAIDLHGAGDDRLDVWLDGELVIRRTPPADMHTQTRTLRVPAGVHDLRVAYEQHAGAFSLRLEWAPPGRPARPFPARYVFHTRPTPADVRLARRTTWLERTVWLGWGAPVAFGLLFLGRRTLRRRSGNAPAATDGLRNGARGETFPASGSPPGSAGYLAAMNALFLALSALFCSNVFLLTDLNSHAILGGDPALMNWQLQWVSRALYTDPLNLFNGNTFRIWLAGDPPMNTGREWA